MAEAKQLCDNNSWADTTSKSKGIIFARSEITVGEVRDGTTNTYLLGEKYLATDRYESCTNDGQDNESALIGTDHDILRCVQNQPMQDRPNYDIGSGRFGSAHAGSFGMAMCDGSAQRISYSVDLATHQYLGYRADGQAAQIPQ